MSTPSGWVNPIGRGLKPARIDMGVDYTGAGPLYAMGSGTITNVFNTGWPGGKFIGLHLDTGQYMYYAENITPAVQVGQKVTAGQKIGQAVGSYPYTEIGWAAAPGTGQTMAAATGESAKGSAAGDPGKYSTGYGVSMSDLIASLGGPAGVMSSGGVQGSVPSGYDFSSGQPATLASSTGSSLPGCIPLIGVIYLAVQSCKRIGRVQGSKRGHRKILLRRTAKQETGRSANASALRGRRWHLFS
jgi:hypothetical protein